MDARSGEFRQQRFRVAGGNTPAGWHGPNVLQLIKETARSFLRAVLPLTPERLYYTSFYY